MRRKRLLIALGAISGALVALVLIIATKFRDPGGDTDESADARLINVFRHERGTSVDRVRAVRVSEIESPSSTAGRQMEISGMSVTLTLPVEPNYIDIFGVSGYVFKHDDIVIRTKDTDGHREYSPKARPSSEFVEPPPRSLLISGVLEATLHPSTSRIEVQVKNRNPISILARFGSSNLSIREASTTFADDSLQGNPATVKAIAMKVLEPIVGESKSASEIESAWQRIANLPPEIRLLRFVGVDVSSLKGSRPITELAEDVVFAVSRSYFLPSDEIIRFKCMDGQAFGYIQKIGGKAKRIEIAFLDSRSAVVLAGTITSNEMGGSNNIRDLFAAMWAGCERK